MTEKQVEGKARRQRYSAEFKRQALLRATKWTAAGFTDTELRCDDETGGGAWLREGHSTASSSSRR